MIAEKRVLEQHIKQMLATYREKILGECPPGCAYTYVIREAGPDGYLKIGTANNPHERLREFQTGNPRALELVAMWDSERCPERAVLLAYVADRVSGEWFRPAPELLNFIESMTTHYPRRMRVVGR